MASKVEIVNMALSHLGTGKEISDLDNETSQEAIAARIFYDTARDKVLRDFVWPFATRVVALGLIEENPNQEWAYSYRYPSDCLKARKILSGIRNDTRQSRVPYRIVSDTSARLVYTDRIDAELEYTVRIDNTSFYPEDFIIAFSYFLAHLMSKRLAKGDQFNLGGKALELYVWELSRAQANSANEEQVEEPPNSEFIITRNSDFT